MKLIAPTIDRNSGFDFDCLETFNQDRTVTTGSRCLKALDQSPAINEPFNLA